MQAKSSIPNSDSCDNYSNPTSSPVQPTLSPKSVASKPHIDPSTQAKSEPHHLDIPIALRKGTHTCTKHPI